MLLSNSKLKVGKFITDKVKAKDVINNLTISLLFDKLPDDVQQMLLKNEKRISINLHIKKFTDIKTILLSQLVSRLWQY